MKLRRSLLLVHFDTVPVTNAIGVLYHHVISTNSSAQWYSFEHF